MKVISGVVGGCLKSPLIYISRRYAQISQNLNNWFIDICEICGIICAYLREAFKDFLNTPIQFTDAGGRNKLYRRDINSSHAINY